MLLASENLLSAASTIGVCFAGYLLTTVFVLPFFSSKTKYLDSQSWIGLQKQWFARFRAGLASLSTTRPMVVEGYEKFSKTGKSWVLPQFFSDPVVILPASKLQEVLSLTDEQLDHQGPNQEATQPKYSTGEDVNDGPHIDVVRRQLTRRLPLLTADVHEELALGMDSNWQPKANEWTTVKAYESCMKIVSRAANRVFCGSELCRNPEFLESTRLYAIATFMTGGKLKLLPKWLHPLAGPIAARPVASSLAVCKRIAAPVMEERLRNMLDPVLAKTYKAPNDALSWMLEDIVERARADPKELNIDLNVRRLMVLNMVAIHTTSIVTTNTLLDLYSHPEADVYVEGLREECERVLAEYDGKWSKDAVNKLIRVDSVIRETMRITTLSDYGLKRKVKPSSGITLSDGTHIPRGVIIAFSHYAIHQDPAYYPDSPNKWDGFRFSAPRETGAKADLTKVLEQKNQNLTATGADFQSFGHGRHACPGRFFASQEMKLMLAHVVMNYDVRVVGGSRPANFHFGGSSVPSDKAELQIKLRER